MDHFPSRQSQYKMRSRSRVGGTATQTTNKTANLRNGNVMLKNAINIATT